MSVLVKIYTQKKTQFYSIKHTHIHMEDQWQDRENKGGEKNKDYKRENADIKRKGTCLRNQKYCRRLSE